ncbi:hypothetical protein, partial [Pseudomonas syringae group genomosp. 7]|uniref:hypothetical protein n=1 Tax=Pseudomonas syringae group genomosp. 7 TaxID=251699 RepID=UPI00376FD6C4
EWAEQGVDGCDDFGDEWCDDGVIEGLMCRLAVLAVCLEVFVGPVLRVFVLVLLLIGRSFVLALVFVYRALLVFWPAA